MKIQRNQPCPCGSGKKYKKCCSLLELNPYQEAVEVSKIQEDCNVALAKIEEGELPSAIIEAERLYDLYPDNHMVNFLQGICAIQKESHQEAICFFEKAVQICPWFCEAYFNLASLYRQELKLVQSVACFKKIIEIEGEEGDLGRLAEKEIHWLRELIQKTSGETLENYLKATTLFDKAFANLKQKRYKEAISFFQQVIKLSPNHVQTYGNIALAYSALGKQKIALQYLDKALLLDPNYEPAQLNRKQISQLKEGERNPSLIIVEVQYYKEKFAPKRKRLNMLRRFFK